MKKIYSNNQKKLIEYAKNLAIKSNNEHLLLEISFPEFNNILVSNKTGQSKIFLKNGKSTLKEFEKYYQLRTFYNDLSDSIKQHGLVLESKPKKNLQLENIDILQDENQVVWIKSKILFYKINSLYYFHTKQFDKAYHFFSEYFNFQQQNNFQYDKMGIKTFITSMLNFLMLCRVLNKEKRFGEILKFLQKEIQNSSLSKAYREELQIEMLNKEFGFYIFNNQFNKAFDIIPDIKNILESKLVNTSYKMSFRIMLAATYCIKEEFELSSQYLWDIINTRNSKRPDIYNNGLFINLIVQYELGNYLLLDSLTTAARRNNKTPNNEQTLELIIIEHIRLLAKEKDNKKKVSLFKIFLEQIDLAVATHIPKSNILEYFNYRAWVYAKVHQISFMEALKLDRR